MNPKPIILFAEDEPSLAQIVTESLATRGFEIIHCADGEIALNEFTKQQPDILVLDVMMPKKDGFAVAKEVRKTNKNIPILFLTAKSQTADVVNGFGIGGNDYLKKPFSMEELIVRIQNLLKNDTAEKITIGKYQFDAVKQVLSINESIETLTFRESELLLFLIDNKNQITPRKVILEKFWGFDDFFCGRSLDVFITKLRKKLAMDSNISIMNLRGLGYKLTD
jgi:DNA-binding response OmpR family regulator